MREFLEDTFGDNAWITGFAIATVLLCAGKLIYEACT